MRKKILTWNGTWMNFGCVAWTIPAGMTGHGESRNPTEKSLDEPKTIICLAVLENFDVSLKKSTIK